MEYLLVHNDPTSAKIFSEDKQLAELKNVGGGHFELSSKKEKWLLNNKVKGEIRPFSIVVFKASDDKSSKAEEKILEIRDHIFFHRGNFYMLGGMPEGRPPREHLTGSKFICRMTNFPFSHPDQIDAETRSHLKKHRGVPVGEISGLGSNGFRVKLENEIDDVGLPLVSSSYLIYSSA